MQNSLIHLLAYISLGSYALGLFNPVNYIGNRIISSFFLVGLLSQILILILVLDYKPVHLEEAYAFTINSSWMIMFCSMLIMLTYALTEPGSPYHTKLFRNFSFVLLIVSLLGFHFSHPSIQYELKPLLLFHIVVSILSQVSVYFVYCLSLLVFFLNKLLKNKARLIDRLPSLLPTKHLLQSGEYIVILLLFGSIISGFSIANLNFEGIPSKFLFSVSFLFLLVISILSRKLFKVSTLKLNRYSLLVWTILLSLQALYKIGLKL